MRKKLHLMYLLLAITFVAQAQNRYFISNNRRVDISWFNQQVQTMIDDMGVPAVSVAVIEDNRVVFANTYGYRSPEKKLKANKNTVFEACSLSKSYLVFAQAGRGRQAKP
jgi:CubicO group peptidase (beta-lactamase class C family)